MASHEMRDVLLEEMRSTSVSKPMPSVRNFPGRGACVPHDHPNVSPGAPRNRYRKCSRNVGAQRLPRKINSLIDAEPRPRRPAMHRLRPERRPCPGLAPTVFRHRRAGQPTPPVAVGIGLTCPALMAAATADVPAGTREPSAASPARPARWAGRWARRYSRQQPVPEPLRKPLRCGGG
jgi:hypothetical protein